MDCKECKHLVRRGAWSRCELFDNVEHYGEIGNEPIVADCGRYEKDEANEYNKYCEWKPLKKIYTHGRIKYLLYTDCGRVVDYNRKADGEIKREYCSKCKKLIKVHYIKGMEG